MKGPMFAAASGFTLNITSSVANPDIRALALSAGWDGASRLTVDITAPLINWLVFAGASFPSGVKLIISASTLIGAVPGGTAIQTTTPLEIVNNGKIYAGGGRGGNGADYIYHYGSEPTLRSNGGAGGIGQGFADASSLTINALTPGGLGSYTQYTGAVFGGDTPPYATGGAGGSGGAWGDPGGGGFYGSYGGAITLDYIYPPSGETPAGCYIDGNAYVTWTTTGDRRGRVK